jgi:hypothetical protein
MEMTWTDTTGQNRSQRAANRDSESCRVEAGYISIERASFATRVEEAKAVRAAWVNEKRCMAERGWMPNIKTYWLDTTEQNRSVDQSERDMDDCADESGLLLGGYSTMSRSEFDIALRKENACMADRGWKAKEKADD